MLHGLLTSRYMAYRLCIKDIQAEYSKSRFGILWDFADPFIYGAIFYTLMHYRVINPGSMMVPYAVYVIFGLMLYQIFCESVTMPLNALNRSRSILTHIKVPPEAFILAIVYRLLFNSAFRIAVMLIFALALAPYASQNGLNSFSLIGFIKFLLLFPMLIVAGLSIGLFLAPFNVFYSDVQRAVKLILLPLRYISPILYPITAPWLPSVNPVASLIPTLRDLATTNTFTAPIEFCAWCCVSLVMLFMGWVIFHLAIPVLGERL